MSKILNAWAWCMSKAVANEEPIRIPRIVRYPHISIVETPRYPSSEGSASMYYYTKAFVFPEFKGGLSDG